MKFTEDDARYLWRYYKICKNVLGYGYTGENESHRKRARADLKKLNVKFAGKLSPGVERKALIGGRFFDYEGWRISTC